MNGLIALSLGAPPWPDIFAQHGYDLYWVAPNFSLASGGEMNPDLIFLSTVRNVALVVEAKGGSSLSDRQLRHASTLTATDLQRAAAVGFASASTAQFSYVVACFENGRQEITKRLDDAGYQYPVLCFFKNRLALVRGKLPDPSLDQVVRGGVELAGPFPTQFIPFDGRSSLGEVASSVIVYIIREIARAQPHFQVEDMLQQAIPIWQRFHPAEKRQMVDAALRVIVVMRKTRGTQFGKVMTPAATARTPNLWAVAGRLPKPGRGFRNIRYETLHSWANKVLNEVKGKRLPPIKPRPDEGTQGALWTRSE